MTSNNTDLKEQVENIVAIPIEAISESGWPGKEYRTAVDDILALIKKETDKARVEGSIAENQKRPGYRYLSKEVKKERKFIYDQLQNGNMTQLLHAQLDGVYRWFEARLPVAKLIDKDRIAELATINETKENT